MSAPSTPRSTRSASAAANSPEMLTPGRKIKAMLAAFDSDSESETGNAVKQSKDASSSNSPQKTNPNPTTRAFALDSDHGDDEDEDEDIIMPRGRMAARLQGGATDNHGKSITQPAAKSAFERVSKTFRAEKEGQKDTRRDSTNDETVSSDDDLPAAGPRRRAQNTGMTRDEDGDSIRSLSRARSYSPLFMSSPTKSQKDDDEEREAVNSANEEGSPKRNNRFLELVAKKRKEREAKERIEAEKKAAKTKERETGDNSNMFTDDESADDSHSGRKKAAKHPRPARKAGKKALEEMSRETQRMSRNMQLAHEAKTKKKITKESFFARFNFMQPQGQTAPEQPGENSSTTAESQHSSDVEAHKDKETPQTSPVIPPADDSTKMQQEQEREENLPTFDDLMNSTVQKSPTKVTDDQTTNSKTELSNVKKGKLPVRVAPARVRLSREQVARHQKDDSSDDDLEIITSPAKCRRIAAFENLPARKVQEPPSMFKLKALAQLTSPSRKSTMNSAELSANLLYQAKQQAGKERRERIEELRAKGIVIETAAERAAFEDEVEDLVEKARQEGEDIAKQERAAAKRENGGGDDDDDSDYELSGSEDGAEGEGEGDADPEEDEQMDDEEIEDEEEAEGAEADNQENLIDSEAGEQDDDDDDESEDEAAAKPPLEAMDIPTQRRKRRTRVVSDDEDEEAGQAPKTPAKPINPFVNSVERPSIPVKPSETTMSLTQAFAGTLAPSQDLSQEMSQQGPPTIPLSLPEPVAMSPQKEPNSPSIIKDSQEPRGASTEPFGYWRADSRVPESPAARSVSQMSQIPDPTQDAGFVLSPFDPNKRFMGTPPQSTIETVIVDRNQSPVAARGMKNLRRGKAPQLSAVEEQEEDEQMDGDFEIDASAFDVMRKASKQSKKQSELFDRKKSKAKDVVEEAAEESDDEYAGLGGASDDDADDEENAFDREMINDNSRERVDAKQLAALNAYVYLSFILHGILTLV